MANIMHSTADISYGTANMAYKEAKIWLPKSHYLKYYASWPRPIKLATKYIISATLSIVLATPWIVSAFMNIMSATPPVRIKMLVWLQLESWDQIGLWESHAYLCFPNTHTCGLTFTSVRKDVTSIVLCHNYHIAANWDSGETNILSTHSHFPLISWCLN